jgi:TP901-1 family phage major tail protein
MAAKAGRKVLFFWKETTDTEYSAATGLRSKSISLNNEGIDITSDDDNGFRTFLSDVSSLRSADVKVSGVLKDPALLAKIATELSIDIRLVIPGVAHFDIEARFTSAELSAEQEDPVTYDYSFSSSGAVAIGNGTPS